MNRRNILKGFLALQSVGYLKPITHPPIGQVQIPSSVKFLIVLDGPFGTILHTTDSDRIQAITPMDLTHQFYLNGALQANDKKHSITLINDLEIVPNENPDLSDAGLQPFHWNSSVDQSITDNLIEIDLPSPDRIQSYCYFQPPANAVFKSGRSAAVPSGYFLEYDNVDAPNTIQMTDDVMGSKPPTPIGSAYGFILEVGLPLDNGNEPDPDGHHAVNFHNQKLLKRFKGILHDRDKQLASINLSSSMVPHKNQRHIIGVPQMPASAVECKAGGLIITTDP